MNGLVLDGPFYLVSRYNTGTCLSRNGNIDEFEGTLLPAEETTRRCLPNARAVVKMGVSQILGVLLWWSHNKDYSMMGPYC